MRPQYKTDHSPPPSAKVRKAWSCTSTSSHVSASSVRERVVNSAHSWVMPSPMCLAFVTAVHRNLQGGKLFLLYVAPVVVDRNIFIWKCHLLIITDIKLRRAQNVRHKSQSGYRRMSPLTIGYAYCILCVLLYPLWNYTPFRIVEYFVVVWEWHIERKYMHYTCVCVYIYT